MSHSFGITSLLCASLCFALNAQAQSDEDERLHQRAMYLRGQQRDEEARAIFQDLWNRTRDPRALARLGLAEQALRDFSHAESHLAQALTVQNNAWISQNAAVLAGSLQTVRAAQGIAVLDIMCNVPTAEWFINGGLVGRVGTPVRASPGTITFEVRAAGFVQVTRTVFLPLGVARREAVNLTEIPITPPPVTNPLVVVRSGSISRTIAWASLGTAAAFLAVGIATYVVGDDAATNWNDDHQCVPPTGATREQVCGDQRQTADAMQIVSAVGFIGAAGLVATAAVLLGVAPPRPQRTGIGCVPSSAHPGIDCLVRF